jgi:hypothetical protein
VSDFLRFTWGGMVRTLNPFLIKPGDLKLCLNYNSDVFYAKVRRTGYSLFLNNPDSTKVWNIIPFDRQDGYRFVLRISGTNIYKYAFTGATWGAATKTGWGGINDQVQTVIDVPNPFVALANAELNAATSKIGQGFKVSGSGSKTVPSLWVLVQKTGTPGNITVQIETDDAVHPGNPSGTIVPNGTATITAPTSTTAAWQRVDFATAPVLTAGTQYHLILTAAGVSGANFWEWYGSIYDVYAGGAAKFSVDSGTSYNVLTGRLDLGFIVNVQQGSRTTSVALGNKLYLSNGVDQMVWTQDGINFTKVADAPYLKSMVVWKNRIYGIGEVYSNKSKLYYSGNPDDNYNITFTNNPLDVSTGNDIDIDPDNYGSDVAVEVEQDRLIVHKQGRSYKIIPDEFGRPSQVVPLGESTTSAYSIGSSEKFNLGFFYGVDGFFQSTGDIPTLISSPIQDLVEGVSGIDEADLFGIFFGYKYYCTMGASITESERLGGRTFTNPLFVYDLRLKEIYLYTVANLPTCFGSWKDINKVAYLYMGDNIGNVFIWDGSYSDNGVAIAGEVETWDDDFQQPHLTKRYEYINVENNPGCEASMMYELDGSNPISLGDVSKGSTKVYFGNDGFNKKNITFMIKDISSTVPSVFYGYVIRTTEEEIPVQRRLRGGAKK